MIIIIDEKTNNEYHVLIEGALKNLIPFLTEYLYNCKLDSF